MTSKIDERDRIKNTILGKVKCEQLTPDLALEIADVLVKSGYGKIRTFAEYVGSKIAGHSNYHGDSILCALYCASEGKEIDSVKPLNITT